MSPDIPDIPDIRLAGTPFHADRTEALNMALALFLAGEAVPSDADLAALKLATWYLLNPHWERMLLQAQDEPAIEQVGGGGGVGLRVPAVLMRVMCACACDACDACV